jgi:hypothetical protein
MMPTTRKTTRRRRGSTALALATLLLAGATLVPAARAQDRVTLYVPLAPGAYAAAAARYDDGAGTTAFLVPTRAFALCPAGAGAGSPCSSVPLKAGARVPGRLVVAPLSATLPRCRCALR